MSERNAVSGFEVVSLDGRDVVTLDINGVLYDMPADVAKVLASDLANAVKRSKGGKA